MEHVDQKNETLLIEDAGRLSLLAHDIRSTYAELQGALNMFEHSFELPAGAQAEINRIAHTSAHLGRLLDFTSGVIFQDIVERPISAAIHNPRRTFNALVQRWQGITKRMGSSLELIGIENMPEQADLDMLALERILSNLVSNALVHATPGPITINVTRFGAASNDWLKFCISDAGPGFPEQTLHDTNQTAVPIGSGEPGSGFGLRVARDAAKSLNGELHLTNTPDGGGEACLTIPIIVPAPEQASPSPTALPHLTVLLVEDSAALRKKMRHELESLGLLVIEATDGAAALDLLSASDAHRIDVVFLDIELPLLSGLQLLSTLKKRGITPPPVIAVTAHIFKPNLNAISERGIVSVLRKPVTHREEIRKVLLETLSDRPVHSETQSEAPEQSDRAELHEDAPACILEGILRQLPTATAHKVLSQLSIDLETCLDTAERSSETNLTHAARQDIGRAAHTLCSLFGLCMATEAQSLARDLAITAPHISHSEIIALLRQLRHHETNIQDKILSILNSEQTAHVANANSDY